MTEPESGSGAGPIGPTVGPSTTAAEPSLLERVLRVTGDVRAGEGRSTATLALTLFMLLCAYYLLKVARESLLLSHYDSEVKVYVAGVQAAVLVPCVWVYGWLSSRVDRYRLVGVVTVFFAANLGVFAALHVLGVPISLPFYIWVGVFNVFVISQLWAFANDVYDESRGRRLFAVIGLGSSFGAIAGSYLAQPIGAAIGTTGLLLVPIALLLGTLVGVRWVHRNPLPKAAEEAHTPSRRGGWALLASERYFVLIAVLMVLLNCENTIGEYLFDRVMQEDIRADLMRTVGHVAEADVEARVRELKSYYFGAFNTLGLLLQLFVAGRVMRRGGAGLAILILPVVALAGNVGVLVTGVAFGAIAAAKISENALDYSVQNTGRNALFLVTTPETKYKVKVLLDSVIVRAGDVLAGAVVLVGAGTLALPAVAFSALTALLSAGWIGVSLAVRREHDRRIDAWAKARVEATERP